MRSLVSVAVAGALLAALAFADSPENNLMPVPAEMTFADGRLALTSSFSVAVKGHDDARLRAGLNNLLRRTEERTGIAFARSATAQYIPAASGAAAALVVDCGEAGPALPGLGDDESYTLDVTSTQAVLRAPNVVGALRGFATLQQLVQSDPSGWFLPAMSIKDRPRFPWRGLMIDVCRHWQPMEVIKRNLDGMALVKLNVLHIHLTEDQGFRIESKKFPRLHELGSDGHYFTQDQMREIIAYAAQRGIRVVPEFDIPGHATSWVVGFPELGSAPGPYVIERKWGIFDPVLDPTNPKVYELLDGFLGEMAALFPDAYLHIGGDENNGVHWTANAAIQNYIREHNLKDNAGLHAYFNIRVNAILAKYGKKLIGWDEILHPDLPTASVVHSWRGPEGIADATKLGHPTILSNGYYIDLSFPTVDHYLNDPAPADSGLTPVQEKLVMGGEATMWSEWVTPETIDSRIWPRTAAIAERLWSRRDVRDVPDMYRRLELVSQRLEETGLHHKSYLDPALRRLAGDEATPDDLLALRDFVDLIEPVKQYQRGQQQPNHNQHTPLTGLVDCARPDSAPARAFAADVEAFVTAPNADAAEPVAAQLNRWSNMATLLGSGLATRGPRLQEADPLLVALFDACAIGEEAVKLLVSGQAPRSDWFAAQLPELAKAAKPHAAAELPNIKSLKLLVAAAAEQSKRATMTPEAWRKHLETLIAPPPAAKAAH